MKCENSDRGISVSAPPVAARELFIYSKHYAVSAAPKENRKRSIDTLLLNQGISNASPHAAFTTLLPNIQNTQPFPHTPFLVMLGFFTLDAFTRLRSRVNTMASGLHLMQAMLA